MPVTAMTERARGDSILIQCDGDSMLVDAGPQEAGDTVNRYLKESAGIDKLQYVVATHSHDDHLFGMPAALQGISVEKVYSSQFIPMTYWFAEILPKTKDQGMIVVNPQEGESFSLGGAEVTFLNVRTDSPNENDHSLACRIVYDETAILLMADAEGEAEIGMLNAGIDLGADVLKVAHHGGNTSTCDAFLNAVNPKYAVISVGIGNPHDHPHQIVLDRLTKRGVILYRTDQFGTVVGTSDGKDWSFEVAKAR